MLIANGNVCNNRIPQFQSNVGTFQNGSRKQRKKNKVSEKAYPHLCVYFKTGNILYQEQMKRKSDGDNGQLSFLIVKN